MSDRAICSIITEHAKMLLVNLLTIDALISSYFITLQPKLCIYAQLSSCLIKHVY